MRRVVYGNAPKVLTPVQSRLGYLKHVANLIGMMILNLNRKDSAQTEGILAVVVAYRMLFPAESGWCCTCHNPTPRTVLKI